MSDCIFCDIISRKIPSDIIYENDNLIVISDLHPKAPIHKLIIPKLHIPTFNEAAPNVLATLGEGAQQLARQLGVQTSGFRLMVNCQRGGGQEIFHLHLHFLANK